MRYRGENLVEKSVNDGYKERYRERRLEEESATQHCRLKGVLIALPI
jgi:hypothetical protein